jgi:hypothetical protein
MTISNFNSNVNVNIQCQCQCQCQFSIQFQSNLKVNCNSPIQCQCLCLNPIPTSNVSFNCNSQSNVYVYVSAQSQLLISLSMSIFNSNQCQFTLNLLLGQQKWSCLPSNQVNDNLPSIGILLNQTFKLYLDTGQVPGSIQKEPVVPAYIPMLPDKRQVQSKRTVCTQLMLCYRSNDKFNPENSLYPAYALLSVKRQVRSGEQFVPSLCFVIGQTASSI